MNQSWALPAIALAPALSAAFLAVAGRRLPYAVLGGVACLSVGLSLILALFLCPAVFGAGGDSLIFAAGPWIATHAFEAGLTLRLDSVALCMTLLVAGFGFLITLYSIGYMRGDGEPARYFASLNLFVASMLVLVLSENLILIFLGWEGVGLCSYLLIGHYWREAGVPLAAFRAFFVNRIGDVFFLLGVFFLYSAFGTVSLVGLDAAAVGANPESMRLASSGVLFLLGGAFAKSAQAPLHVWLADAMAGPTPVSALIHAATMVTAGIYLVARLDGLYAFFPAVRLVIAVCALLTLVIGALMALTQTDIKKILAYSTLSNLALMFLALAAGGSGAAMLHLFGHAFFKALLFLAAGSVIVAAHHEQNVLKLAGVLRKLPVTNVAFWVGCIGGAGLLPYLSAGFFSKEAVLESLKASQIGIGTGGFSLSPVFLYWTVFMVECITVLYLFRLLGILHGKPQAQDSQHTGHPHGGEIKESSFTIRLVLGLLTLAAPIFGVFSATSSFGGSGFLFAAVTGGADPLHGPNAAHAAPFILVYLVLAAMCYLAFSNGRRRENLMLFLRGFASKGAGPLQRKFYFDDIYEYLIVRPLFAAGWVFREITENIFAGLLIAGGWAGMGASNLLKALQTGKAHQYAMTVMVATLLLVFLLSKG